MTHDRRSEQSGESEYSFASGACRASSRGTTGPVPQDVHGPISIGPKGIRGVTDRVYFGHGTGSDGILQIVDRKKLLDPAGVVTLGQFPD